MKSKNKGFTLVELIVVLVILAILAAILVPQLMGYIERANSEKDFSTAQTVRVAAQACVDQAFGNKRRTTSEKKEITEEIIKVADMNGEIGPLTPTYGAKVYDLSGVDKTKVDSFFFKYESGTIVYGWVRIDGIYYKLQNGEWSSNGKTIPKFT